MRRVILDVPENWEKRDELDDTYVSSNEKFQPLVFSREEKRRARSRILSAPKFKRNLLTDEISTRILCTSYGA